MALSGNQTTRMAFGQPAAALPGFTAKSESVVVVAFLIAEFALEPVMAGEISMQPVIAGEVVTNG